MIEKQSRNPSGYDMPRPTRFAILDDLSNRDPILEALLVRLTKLVNTKEAGMLVSVETLSRKLAIKYKQAVERNQIPPIDIAITLGKSGIEVAEGMDATFPTLNIHPRRLKKPDGKNIVGTKSGIPLDDEVKLRLTEKPQSLLEAKTIALIDDTIFSGSTIKGVLDAIKSFFPGGKFIGLTLIHVPVFSKEYLSPNDITIIAALSLRTSKLRESGLDPVDAKDFIEDDALILGDKSMPFMEEDNWMYAWFGKNYEQAMEICKQMKEYRIKLAIPITSNI